MTDTVEQKQEITEVEFLGETFTVKSLESKSLEELLLLRNLVADNLGVSAMKKFKDRDQALKTTWKALVKFAEATDEELGSNVIQKKIQVKKTPERVKGAEPMIVKRPTRKMFCKIKKISKPERVLARWDNYHDGMTLVEIMEGHNMTPNDITWYVKNGHMELIEPTQEEYEASLDQWYISHNLENPNTAKKQKKETQDTVKKQKKEKSKPEATSEVSEAA